MEWISVEDGLPNKHEKILIYSEEGSMWVIPYNGSPSDLWQDEYNDSGDVTHWQPLPSPPKES